MCSFTMKQGCCKAKCQTLMMLFSHYERQTLTDSAPQEHFSGNPEIFSFSMIILNNQLRRAKIVPYHKSSDFLTCATIHTLYMHVYLYILKKHIGSSRMVCFYNDDILVPEMLI